MRILLLISFLLPLSLHAQHLRAGLMFTDVYNTPFIEHHSPKWHYSLGVSVNIDPEVWDSFFLLAETRYAEKGYLAQIDEGSIQRDFQLEFHYVYQTFAGVYRLTPHITPYAGLELGVLAYTQLAYTPLNANTKYIHLKDTYNPVDFGLLTGVQFFSSSWLSLDVRASSSILPVLRYESFDDFGNPTGRIRGVNHFTVEAAAMLRLFKFRYQQ